MLAGVDHGQSVLDHAFRTVYGLGKHRLRRRRRNLGHPCLIRDKILLNSSVRQPMEMLEQDFGQHLRKVVLESANTSPGQCSKRHSNSSLTLDLPPCLQVFVQDLCKVRELITCNRVVMQVDDVRRSEYHRVAASVPRHLTPAGWTLLVPDPLRHAPACPIRAPRGAPPKLRKFAGSAVAAKAATALPPILPSAELIFAATAQPPKSHWRRRRSRQGVNPCAVLLSPALF